jgi:hypothetical protein
MCLPQTRSFANVKNFGSRKEIFGRFWPRWSEMSLVDVPSGCDVQATVTAGTHHYGAGVRRNVSLRPVARRSFAALVSRNSLDFRNRLGAPWKLRQAVQKSSTFALPVLQNSCARRAQSGVCIIHKGHLYDHCRRRLVCQLVAMLPVVKLS